MKKLLLLLFFPLFFLCSCDHQTKNAKVHCYKVANGNDFLYYYFIYSNISGGYYYSSPTYLTSLTGVTWQSASTLPEGAYQQIQENQEYATLEEPLSELPDEIEVEMESPDNSQETTETETSTDSDNGDAGGDSGDSGDSGGDSGGDGGGGDGGSSGE